MRLSVTIAAACALLSLGPVPVDGPTPQLTVNVLDAEGHALDACHVAGLTGDGMVKATSLGRGSYLVEGAGVPTPVGLKVAVEVDDPLWGLTLHELVFAPDADLDLYVVYTDVDQAQAYSPDVVGPTLPASPADQPANDLCEDAIAVAVPSSTIGTTAGAGVDSGFPTCGTAITSPGVWYTVVGTGTTMTATTCTPAPSYDTKISVYCGGCSAPLCIDGNDDDCATGSSGLLSTVTWCGQAGAEYWILVHGFGGTSGDFVLDVYDDGVPCEPTVECLPPELTGACCFSDGSCEILTAAECAAAGGDYQGDDTECYDIDDLDVALSMPGLAIPDDDPLGVSDTVIFATPGEIGDVNFLIGVTHTWVGDLIVTLEHGGTTVTLIDRQGVPASTFGCSADNWLNPILDDEGEGGSIENQCVADLSSPPSYLPEEALSAFDGMEASGPWTLTISDNAAGDTGILEFWAVECGFGEPVCEEQVHYLDIKPGSCPNPLNRKSHGVLPVALLGTEDFDVSQVMLETVVLGRADGMGGTVMPNEGPPGPHSVYADVGTPFEGEECECHMAYGDGFMDLSMKFKTQDLVDALMLDDFEPGDYVTLRLTAVLMDGTVITADDCVRIVPPVEPPGLTAVTSTGSPGAWFGVEPADVWSDAGGFGPFVRKHEPGTVVEIKAPAWHDGAPFVGWTVQGEVVSTERVLLWTVATGGARLVALYGPEVDLQGR